MTEGGDVPPVEMRLLKDLGDRLALVEKTVTLQMGVDPRFEALAKVREEVNGHVRPAKAPRDGTLEHLVRKSFTCAQVAMFIGLALIVFGVVAVPLQPDLLSKAQVGLASGVGAATTLYIRTTFLRIFNKIANEFKSLSEMERKRVSEDNRWRAVGVILDKADLRGAAALIRALAVPSVENGTNASGEK